MMLIQFIIYISTLINILQCKNAPNIIFIVVDDLGYDDLGIKNNNQIHTVNIDSLRSKGQFLEWYYGQCYCSPTRTAIQTGLYPLHNSINKIIPPTDQIGVPTNFTFISKILYDAGYTTHAIGKWHMGFYKWRYTPTWRGYESFYGYYNGAEDYFTHERSPAYDFHDETGIHCGENCSRLATEAYGQYSAQLFTSRAIEIVTNHSKSTDNKPLFLYLPYQSVHGPAEVPQRYMDEYNKSINNTKRRKFAGMLTAVDEGIGNLTKTLDSLGYLDDKTGNTLIILSSDNGGPVNGVGDAIGSSNYPLRGGKESVWEGGVRITGMIFGTSDVIPSNLRGNNYTQLMHAVDWYPTLLSAAGININNIGLNYSLDGVNHWKGIIGSNVSDSYFEYRDNVWMGYEVSTQSNLENYNNTAFRYKWNKIINGTGGKPYGWYRPPSTDESIVIDDELTELNELSIYLFDLQNDPNEHNNVTDNNLLQQLYSMMINVEKDGVPQAQPDKNCPPIIYPNNSVVGPYWWPWCGV